MRVASLTVTAMLASAPALAETVPLAGAIGPYEIEMELENTDGFLSGRYRYAGREAWLDLAGETFGQDAAYIQEFASGELSNPSTGDFYLEVNGGGLTGFWVGAGRDYPVDLQPLAGGVDLLFEAEDVPDLTDSLTGRYNVGGYWVNDWFAPNYEIGFNGGAADVVRLGPDHIGVAFNFVVGPTYHIASFRGLAVRSGPDVYVHDSPLEGGDEPCRLVFDFSEASLTIIDQDNGFACQFGMRAHANFTLQKTSNIAEFGEDW